MANDTGWKTNILDKTSLPFRLRNCEGLAIMLHIQKGIVRILIVYNILPQNIRNSIGLAQLWPLNRQEEKQCKWKDKTYFLLSVRNCKGSACLWYIIRKLQQVGRKKGKSMWLCSLFKCDDLHVWEYTQSEKLFDCT